jgi:branched-chain amino acid transport system ATP-binding protein
VVSVLAIDDIHTYYGESYVLKGVSLSVEPGTIVALLGRNGVGKTTTIRSVIGFTPARRGKILFKGADITHEPAYAIARRGVGLVPQGRRIFGSLSVEEQITLGAGGADGQWGLERVYALFPRLKERRRQRAITLSGGEQSMLSIGRALLMNPELLLLDEPTEGLAPLIVEQVATTIQTLKRERQTILLVEQDLALALNLADYVYIMNKGIIVFEGRPGELRENHGVQSQFLGI